MSRAELANEAKTEFLATISHEMRTPLNAVLGSAELALQDSGDPAQLHAHLLRISESATVLKRLITDILDVSKIEAGQVDVQLAPLDLRACLEAALGPAAERAHAQGLGFALVCDDAVPATVLTDGERLRQIVGNLAENAVKFTDSGDVRVVVSRVAADGEREARIEIRVVDTGTGIAAGAEEHIFERFVQGDASTTRRKGGAGLGLGIAKSLAEALGGAVTVRNRTEGGAEFLVTLPLVAAEERGASTGPPRAARILVAEDNDVNFAMFEAYLDRSGYQVQRALDGAQAVAGADGCDLILMDVEMPGMDGLEATRRIRASEAERGSEPTPVLAITAHAIQEYRDRCLDAGCTGYLTKPVGMQTLVDAVAGALDAVPR
jgi:CheY-like chemotaxis protein/anti-sigma regulatory factor (Ser/Thr protein kinase)